MLGLSLFRLCDEGVGGTRGRGGVHLELTGEEGGGDDAGPSERGGGGEWARGNETKIAPLHKIILFATHCVYINARVYKCACI